jgi:hypothetical protein
MHLSGLILPRQENELVAVGFGMEYVFLEDHSQSAPHITHLVIAGATATWLWALINLATISNLPTKVSLPYSNYCFVILRRSS